MHVVGVSSWTICCILDDEIATDLCDFPGQTDTENQNLDLNSLLILSLVLCSVIILLRALRAVEENFTWKGSHILKESIKNQRELIEEKS